MDDVMAKGVTFLYAKKFILENYGEDVWNRILASLSQDAVKVWRDTPLVASLYPFRSFKMMTTALAKEIGAVKEAETARIYEYIAENSLSKVYQIFFHMTNPSFVLKNYPKLWSRFFDSGKVEVPSAEKGSAVIKFTLPDIFLDWISPACLGFSKKAVEMAGGRNLLMQQISKTVSPDRAWEIVFELKWDE